MQKIFLFCLLFAGARAAAQTDTAVANLMNSMDEKIKNSKTVTPVFYSQKLINTNTVEVLHKGILEFKVIHNFGDVAGKNGGIKRFFGLDNASDVKIAFQLGITDKLNLVAARVRGGGNLQQLYETGIKYQFIKQEDGNKSRPLSVTAYANLVICTMTADTNKTAAQLAIKENHFENFSDRLSQLVQVMVAKHFGKISLQLTPTYLHTNYVVTNDQKGMFAIGGGARIPLSKKFILVADYFHPFRTAASEKALKSQYAGFYDEDRYDVFGVGVEIVTPGHLFHLNFTNATNILENRFLPRTFSSWGKGQYRWGFTVARNFVVFRDKKNK
ncbi:MAG: DUF5777 family beta-barrel protein [Ferruginibacter sp.]